jgi:predicted methyltransferase
MGESIFKTLKPGGKLVLIEYRLEDPGIPIKRLHKMSQKQAIKEISAVGLKWLETSEELPQQHFMVFQKPK